MDAIVLDSPWATQYKTTPEAERPLEATPWGEPACGRAAARLPDGAVVRWIRGAWSVTPQREVRFQARVQ